jgi:hypothetical protein
MKPAFTIIYDKETNRYPLVYAEGDKTGKIADWNDPEWYLIDGCISAEFCGVDKNFTEAKPPYHCDYSVRFLTREGAEFFLYALTEYHRMHNNYRNRMQKKIPESLLND